MKQDESVKKHLLIISCSERKDPRSGLLPAINRYTGAWYGVIKKLKREKRFPNNVDILIISAKYGLINANMKIEYYDQKMDCSRAKELRESIINKLQKILSETNYENILINLGSIYMQAISGIEEIIPESTKSSLLLGKIGERKRDLKKWLLSIK